MTPTLPDQISSPIDYTQSGGVHGSFTTSSSTAHLRGKVIKSPLSSPAVALFLPPGISISLEMRISYSGFLSSSDGHRDI